MTTSGSATWAFITDISDTAINNAAAITANTTQIASNGSQIAQNAPVASPSFTGTPSTETTPAQSSDNTTLATTAFVHTAVSFDGGGTNFQTLKLAGFAPMAPDVDPNGGGGGRVGDMLPFSSIPGAGNLSNLADGPEIVSVLLVAQANANSTALGISFNIHWSTLRNMFYYGNPTTLYTPASTTSCPPLPTAAGSMFQLATGAGSWNSGGAGTNLAMNGSAIADGGGGATSIVADLHFSGVQIGASVNPPASVNSTLCGSTSTHQMSSFPGMLLQISYID